jgi:small subunit ribosomal protein S6
VKRYEVIFVSRADIPSEETTGVIEKYTSIINTLGGTIVKVDKWGKRRLAYHIRKKREGIYTLIDFGGETKIIKELERNFKIDDAILRYLSVKLGDSVDPDALKREMEEIKRKSDISAVPAHEETSDESISEATASSEEPSDEQENEASHEEKTGEQA